jgi:sugar lactone lactonase YvrE
VEEDAMAIETVLDVHATIGESATWVAEERVLYWIDVKAPALHRYCPDDKSTRSWPMTSDIGGFALTGDGSAVVALRQGLFRLDLDSGALHKLAPPPFDSTKAPATPTVDSGSA